MPNSTDADLETCIAEAERAVIETDEHFLRSTRELASAMRGRAGNAAALSAVAGSALLAAFVVHRITSNIRRARRHRHRPATYHAAALPPRRSGAAGFIGETVGTAWRASVAPRPAGLVSMLTAAVLPLVTRMTRR